jgi:hypothetical protein
MLVNFKNNLMKKIICFFLFASLCTAKVLAQKIPIMVNVGFGPSNVKNNINGTSSGFAYTAGIESFFTAKHFKNSELLINPMISYMGTGYSVKASPTTNVNQVKVQYITIQAPITIAFSDNFIGGKNGGLFYGAGPYLSLAIAGKYNTNIAGAGYTKMKFGNSTTDNRAGMDFGYNLRGGIKLAKTILSLQLNRGLVNVMPKDRVSNGEFIRTRSFLFQMSFKL